MKMSHLKNIFKHFILPLIILLMVSCRNNNIPEDIHEHEEANRVVVTVSEVSTGSIQTVTYAVGSGTDRSLTLENGKTYNVDVKFYYVQGSFASDLTPEIITEKDEHFLEYSFAGVGVSILRDPEDATRSDGKKLGLKTQWTVNSTPSSAKAEIKLIHSPISVDDAANGGLGSHNGGETDVVVIFDVK